MFSPVRKVETYVITFPNRVSDSRQSVMTAVQNEFAQMGIILRDGVANLEQVIDTHAIQKHGQHYWAQNSNGVWQTEFMVRVTLNAGQYRAYQAFLQRNVSAPSM